MKFLLLFLFFALNLFPQQIIAVKGSKAKVKLKNLRLKKGKKYTFHTTTGKKLSFLVYKIKSKKAYIQVIEGEAIKGSSFMDTGSTKFKSSHLKIFKHEVSINPLSVAFRALNFNYNYFISKNYSVGPEVSIISGSYTNTDTTSVLFGGQVPGSIKIEDRSELGGFAFGFRGNYYLKNVFRGFFIPHGISYVSAKADPFATITIDVPSQFPTPQSYPNIAIPEISLTGASAYAGFGYAYSFGSFVFKGAGGARYNLLTKEVDFKLNDIPGSNVITGNNPLLGDEVIKYDTSGASGIFPYLELSVGYRF